MSRFHIITDIDHPEVHWRCAALRCGCGNEAYAKKTCAYYEPLMPEVTNERDLGIALRKAHIDGVESLSVEQLDLISSAISQAQYDAAQRKCKHLNLRLDGSNHSAGAPFYCLDCGANPLPWTALNALLTELHDLVKGKSDG